MLTLNLGLDNAELYKDCEIETVAGRLNLKTPPKDAAEKVGINVARLVAAVPPDQRDQVVLTGAMAVWSYLIVFHAVVHSFRAVVYDDGKGNQIKVAAHG